MTPLVVFDVDGTLVDSRELLLKASDAAFHQLGLPPPPYEALRKIVGLSLHDGLARLVPDLGPDDVAAIAQAYRDNFRAAHGPDFVEPLYDGAAELLDRLKATGWRIAMATGKSRRGVETIMAMHGWGATFDSTHCSDDAPGKPHPAMLQCAMRAADAAPADTVMVGDTIHDIGMARAAGVWSIGVVWGFNTRAEIAEAGADVIAESFEELARGLQAFAARCGGRATPGPAHVR